MTPFLARHFPRLRFSWAAAWLAPLIATAIIAALFALGEPGANERGELFLLAFVIGCFVSYACMFGLLLPGLCLLSRITSLTAWKVIVLGAVLAWVPYLAIAWMMWKSSGPDSGPPVESFARSLAGDWKEFFPWCFFAAGAVTAGVYHALARRRPMLEAERVRSR